jgi:hypothetical protein
LVLVLSEESMLQPVPLWETGGSINKIDNYYYYYIHI